MSKMWHGAVKQKIGQYVNIDTQYGQPIIKSMPMKSSGSAEEGGIIDYQHGGPTNKSIPMESFSFAEPQLRPTGPNVQDWSRGSTSFAESVGIGASMLAVNDLKDHKKMYQNSSSRIPQPTSYIFENNAQMMNMNTTPISTGNIEYPSQILQPGGFGVNLQTNLSVYGGRDLMLLNSLQNRNQNAVSLAPVVMSTPGQIREETGVSKGPSVPQGGFFNDSVKKEGLRSYKEKMTVDSGELDATFAVGEDFEIPSFPEISKFERKGTSSKSPSRKGRPSDEEYIPIPSFPKISSLDHQRICSRYPYRKPHTSVWGDSDSDSDSDSDYRKYPGRGKSYRRSVSPTLGGDLQRENLPRKWRDRSPMGYREMSLHHLQQRPGSPLRQSREYEGRYSRDHSPVIERCSSRERLPGEIPISSSIRKRERIRGREKSPLRHSQRRHAGRNFNDVERPASQSYEQNTPERRHPSLTKTPNTAGPSGKGIKEQCRYWSNTETTPQYMDNCLHRNSSEEDRESPKWSWDARSRAKRTTTSRKRRNSKAKDFQNEKLRNSVSSDSDNDNESGMPTSDGKHNKGEEDHFQSTGSLVNVCELPMEERKTERPVDHERVVSSMSPNENNHKLNSLQYIDTRVTQDSLMGTDMIALQYAPPPPGNGIFPSNYIDVAVVGHTIIPDFFLKMGNVRTHIFRLPEACIDDIYNNPVFHDFWKYRYSVTILFVGGYDLFKFPQNSKTIDAYEKLILDVTAKDSRVIPCVLEARIYKEGNPNNKVPRDYNKRSREVNRSIRNYLQMYDYYYIDLRKGFPDSREDDGIYFDQRAMHHFIMMIHEQVWFYLRDFQIPH